MAPPHQPKGPREFAPPSLEERIRQLSASLQALQAEVNDLKKAQETFQDRLSESSGRYVATCPKCRTVFDMLAHHYSIGLFDNLVYVKCPKCQKALPVKGGSGGQVGVVES